MECTISNSLPGRGAVARFRRERLRIEHRATQRFAWHYQTIDVAGVSRRFATASQPDQLLLEACRQQEAGRKDVADPYWAAVWQAAVGLDHYLGSLDMFGHRVLELGAGTGRAGLAAAIRGADVTITDGVSDPLLLATLSTMDLENCRVRQLLWAEQRLETQFSMLIGSDVTYNRRLWPQLEQAMQDHLAADGVVLLSDPERLIGDEFRAWIQNRPWQYDEHHTPHCEDADRCIRVMEIRRRQIGSRSRKI